MTVEYPLPEEMESALSARAAMEVADSTRAARSDQVRAESAVASRYWGEVQYRMIATFLAFTACWLAVIVAGVSGVVPLWLGLILNSFFATTFYMPMHEATHKNIMGRSTKTRVLEEIIGRLCSIPTGMEFTAHRASHMRHHAHTNDPTRDPDHFTSGRLRDLPKKFYGMTMLSAFLLVFAVVKPARVLLPLSLREKLSGRDGSKEEGKAQLLYWVITTTVLGACLATGHGLAALCLWWIPARIQFCWLIFIFAWYPHHPANETSRYRHTRVAVFPGSGVLIRGHDYHAIHHLYPRVPHYRLRAVWKELSSDLVRRGVRAEGRAQSATGPVVW